MTLEELLKIIKEKRENAEKDYIREMHKNKKYPYELKGALDTYDDLICLIESKMNHKEEKVINKTCLEKLQNLGEFNDFDIEDNEDFKDVYIKLKGQRLCKITNCHFDNYNGCVYKVVGTEIQKKETYNECLDLEIPVENQNWEKYATIQWIGKKSKMGKE